MDRLCYLKSINLYHLNEGGGEECRNAILCVCLMPAGTQLLWQPLGKHTCLRLSTLVFVCLTTQALILFFFLIVTCDFGEVFCLFSWGFFWGRRVGEVFFFFFFFNTSNRMLQAFAQDQTFLVSAAL